MTSGGRLQTALGLTRDWPSNDDSQNNHDGTRGRRVMANTPKERLSILKQKVERQRNTVELLKRDRHECADAERQLKRLLAELQGCETRHRDSG